MAKKKVQYEYLQVNRNTMYSRYDYPTYTHSASLGPAKTVTGHNSKNQYNYLFYGAGGDRGDGDSVSGGSSSSGDFGGSGGGS